MFINDLNRDIYKKAYTGFLRSLSLLTDVHLNSRGDERWAEQEFNLIDSCYSNCDYPTYWVRSMYREVGCPDDKMKSPEVVTDYVMMCVGHKINPKKFLGFPRLCVLYSWKILKCRFKLAEKMICSDSLACYFYSKLVVRKILPPEMHNGLLLRSFERHDPHFVRYLRDFPKF